MGAQPWEPPSADPCPRPSSLWGVTAGGRSASMLRVCNTMTRNLHWDHVKV